MSGTKTQAQLIDLPQLESRDSPGPALLGNSAALLDGVTVRLSVVVGGAQTTLAELMALKEAAVLKVDRAVDAPVDVLVNGKVVARGDLVAVDDNFGVRITEIAALG